VLTLTLRQLERDDLLTRTAHAVVRPASTTSLTPLGSSLLGEVEPLVAWTRLHRDKIAVARAAYDTSLTRP